MFESTSECFITAIEYHLKCIFFLYALLTAPLLLIKLSFRSNNFSLAYKTKFHLIFRLPA